MMHAGRKYQVNLKKSVIKVLEKLPDMVLRRIQKTILALSDIPRTAGSMVGTIIVCMWVIIAFYIL